MKLNTEPLIKLSDEKITIDRRDLFKQKFINLIPPTLKIPNTQSNQNKSEQEQQTSLSEIIKTAINEQGFKYIYYNITDGWCYTKSGGLRDFMVDSAFNKKKVVEILRATLNQLKYHYYSNNENSQNDYQKFCDQLIPNKHHLYHILDRSQKISYFKDNNSIKEPELEQIMTNFFNMYQNKNKTLLQSHENIDTLFSTNFIIGEMHQDSSSKKFLINNFARLKSEFKIEVLFLEHFYYDDQELLDNFYATGKIDKQLDIHINMIDDTFQSAISFKELITAAQKSGIRIVGIDTEAIYFAQYSHLQSINGYPSFETNDNFRIHSMNYTATKIIEKEIGNSAKKWCALMGSAHTDKYKNIPGVAEIMDAHSIWIYDIDQTHDYESLEYNATFYKEETLNYQEEINIKNITALFYLNQQNNYQLNELNNIPKLDNSLKSSNAPQNLLIKKQEENHVNLQNNNESKQLNNDNIKTQLDIINIICSFGEDDKKVKRGFVKQIKAHLDNNGYISDQDFFKYLAKIFENTEYRATYSTTAAEFASKISNDTLNDLKPIKDYLGVDTSTSRFGQRDLRDCLKKKGAPVHKGWKAADNTIKSSYFNFFANPETDEQTNNQHSENQNKKSK